ncbi:MAG: hypothetical protein AAB449_00305 [Patescibacteria group bacterium]
MKKILLALALLLLVGYGIFEARRLLEGPQIVLISPQNGSATSSAVWVTGTAHNISFLTVNDQHSYTDEGGTFRELLVPPPGVTVITVAGVDRFGRKTTESVSITMLNYCPLS